MKFRVIIEADEDGVFVATCPSLPGCVSQGATRAEARTNIQEAIEAYLESLERHGEPIPPSIDEEIVEVTPGDGPQSPISASPGRSTPLTGTLSTSSFPQRPAAGAHLRRRSGSEFLENIPGHRWGGSRAGPGAR